MDAATVKALDSIELGDEISVRHCCGGIPEVETGRYLGLKRNAYGDWFLQLGKNDQTVTVPTVAISGITKSR